MGGEKKEKKSQQEQEMRLLQVKVRSTRMSFQGGWMTRVQRRHRQELDLFLAPECVLHLIC